MLNYDAGYWLDMSLRIGLALLAGALVGVNRDLHRKSIGLRTLGLVSLGACLLVLTVSQYAQQHGFNSSDGASRVTQGIVSGIGFLGAGVILRGPDQIHVYGLTTAAAILVVAALGIACALAEWPILIVGFVATLFLLIVCGPIEHAIQIRIERHEADAAAKDSPRRKA
ncbi:MgtC/SapB family protein [Nevskia soli]|uniref:MgtC/SapB family protein n=1 Tax=Nevskia soli TaxID=418856 RepID=UPI0005688AB5|nr:MgtC/SapB family protein [Nevskia soli]